MTKPTDAPDDLLARFACLGAKVRLLELTAEQTRIYRAFPELQPEDAEEQAARRSPRIPTLSPKGRRRIARAKEAVGEGQGTSPETNGSDR